MKGESSIKIYSKPFSEKVKTEIMNAPPDSKYAHENSPISKFANDFLVPKGTEIKSMEGGRVCYVQSGSEEYGLGEEFVDKANMIAVQNKDGTIIEYVHMDKDVSLEVGDKVRKGDVLGRSGLSGYMSKDSKYEHVHVNKFKVEDGKAISLPYGVVGVKKSIAPLDKERLLKIGDLEKQLGRVAAAIFIVGIGMALVSFSGITGNVVGVSGGSFSGIVSFIASLLVGGVWMFLRKKI